MYALVVLVFLINAITVNSLLCDDLCVCDVGNGETPAENVDCRYSRPVLFIIEDDLPSNVHRLDLSANNITYISAWYLFQSSTMKELILTHNQISNIETNALQLPELRKLDASDNELESIDKNVFNGVKNLQYLNLANNRFTTVVALHRLSNLNQLILDNNDIGASLTDTSLFDRKGFGLTRNVKELSISGINLNVVRDNFFSEPHGLKRLTISNNNLVDIFEIPYTLEYLDISDNPIAEISSEDFEDLPALVELKLNNLGIKAVPDYVFVPLRGLVRLELERNRNLTQFSSLAFGREVLDDADDFVLEALSLSGSRVGRLDGRLETPLGQLARLDLQGNPWVCDCGIAWLKRLQLEKSEYDHLRCGSPRNLANARIFDLDDEYFVCAANKHYVGLALAAAAFCVVLAMIAIWFFVFIPKYYTRNATLRNMYAPSTAYTVLPVSSSSLHF